MKLFLMSENDFISIGKILPPPMKQEDSKITPLVNSTGEVNSLLYTLVNSTGEVNSLLYTLVNSTGEVNSLLYNSQVNS